MAGMPASPRPPIIARAAFALVMLPAVAVGACGTTTPGSPTPTQPATSSTATPSSAATATPTAATTACTGSELTAALGAENSASGGAQQLTVLLANHSGTACKLSGSLGAELLDSSGGALTTSLESAPPSGSAWLVPDRVALDAWWPQPGEATVTVNWHTGDVQPGQCSGAAPSVGEVSISVPGGGTVIGVVPAASSMAPCKGVIELGAIIQAAAPQAFQTVLGATFSAVGDEHGLDVTESCTPTPTQECLTTSTGPTMGSANTAAYQQFDLSGTGGGAVCYSYVYEDSAGWHPLDVACAQNTGYNPIVGVANYVFGPGSGCADVYSSASHASGTAACLPWSASGSGSQYTVDQGPTYTAETDPTSGQPASTIWWHLQGQGWITQDFLVAPPEA
jgi:hypothetical protein